MTAVPSPNLSPTKRALLALTDLKAKLAESERVQRPQQDDIAVIGVGCRFPQGKDPDGFWNLLRRGTDAITEIPESRWDKAKYYDPDPKAPGKLYCPYGGFLDGIDGFDPQFFNISPREARALDPQQRLLLEVSWEALEHGNQVSEHLFNTETGVFVGIATTDYALQTLKTHQQDIDAYYGTGNALSMAAGRVSYLLGLTGPAMAIDTACSSSLVSVHLACQSLQQAECNLALAGGVSLILSPENSISFAKARMLAPDGRCKTFDDSANGYVRGEGCGVVVLKRLKDAIAEGDNILAVIRGSAVNQDGPSGGLTVPNGPAQQLVIRKALDSAGIEPKQVQYVEAHGTGTSLGDPIEIQALGAVYGEGRSPEDPLMLGAVKTNIGHLESAAGIAGLIKLVLSLHHEELPPHLHFQTPSAKIPWSDLPVKVLTQNTPWLSGSEPRIAGVSSFGFSGTNAHIILQEAPTATVSQDSDALADCPVQVLTLSARSPEALQALASRYADFVATRSDLSLQNICFTANAYRSRFKHRLACVSPSRQDLETQLKQWNPDQLKGVKRAQNTPPKIAFVFTGQGSQYSGMGQQLFESQPLFREVILQCDEILKPLLSASLLELLYPQLYPSDLSPDCLNNTRYTQPALFAVEYALAQLWLSWGISPTMMMGHSLGEYIAACVAGVFSLEDGLKLIVQRAKLMAELPLNGSMAAVLADEVTIRKQIAPYGDQVGIAAINGPTSLVISGEKTAIAAILADLDQAGVKVRPLPVSHAFHSALMEPMLAAFETAARSVTFAPPQINLISNLTGTILDSEMATPEYWVKHLREPVQFLQSTLLLVEKDYDVVVEIGPKPIVLGMAGRITQTLSTRSWLGIPSLQPPVDDWTVLMTSLGLLAESGLELDWTAIYSPWNPQRVTGLPTYPFQRKRYWFSEVTPPILAPQKASQTASQNQRSVNQPVALASAKSSVRQPEILALLRDNLGAILELESESLDVHTPLLQFGADSINLMEWVQSLEFTFQIEIPVRQFFEDLNTLDKIATYLDQTLPSDWSETLPFQESTNSIGVEAQETDHAAQQNLSPTFNKTDEHQNSMSESLPTHPMERVIQEQLAAMQNVMTQQLQAMQNIQIQGQSILPPSRPTNSLGQNGGRKAQPDHNNIVRHNGNGHDGNGHDGNGKNGHRSASRPRSPQTSNQREHHAQTQRTEGAAPQLDEMTASDVDVGPLELPTNRSPQRKIYALSPAQRQMWWVETLTLHQNVYLIPVAVRLEGVINLEALEASFNQVIGRHESLRTNIKIIENTPTQVVSPIRRISVTVQEMKGQSDLSTIQTQLDALSQPEFQLDTDLLLRCQVLQWDDTTHVLLLVFHHLIADAWSAGVFLREMLTLYPAINRGKARTLPDIPIPYGAFVTRERELIDPAETQKNLNFWRSRLSDAPAELALPLDFPRPAQRSFHGQTYHQPLSQPLSQSLKRCAQDFEVTLFMLLLGAYSLLLNQYSDQTDLVIGSTQANRQRQTQGLIGLFLNTILLRVNVGKHETLSTFLNHIKRITLDAFAVPDIPFESLGDSSGESQQKEWFQAMFILQNTPRASLSLPDLSLEQLPVHGNSAKCDLTLWMEETPEGLRAEWEYASDVFAPETIARIASQYEHWLQVFVEASSEPLGMLPPLGRSEKVALGQFRSGVSPVSSPLRPVHQVFEARVAQHPQASALVDLNLTSNDASYSSYGELNQRANQIAHFLLSQNIESGDRVAVCLDRSGDLIATFLGILKIGATYIPLDPTYPQARLDHMLSDAQPKVLISTHTVGPSEFLPPILNWETTPLASQPSDNPQVSINLEQIAYIIYTSGSTGTPKGTCITHLGLANFIREAIAVYGFSESDRILQFASSSFDAAVEEIYGALCSGGTLVLRTDEMVSSSAVFFETCEQEKISVLDLPTAFWHRLIQDVAQGEAHLPKGLTQIIIGGERVLPSVVQLWQQHTRDRAIRLFNTYGPTEATVVATTYEITPETSVSSEVDLPIGQPLGHVEIYVLNSQKQPVPLGASGELYLGGWGISTGYLNQTKLTAERFIEHPFQGEGKLYQTGDRVRLLPDGNLIYLGRMDDQVKVRGFRVELGEVENALYSHPQVSQCAVIAHEDDQGVQQLVAYVVSEQETLHLSKLRNFLQGIMPHYMIPSLFIPLDSLPLTPAGKVNRRSLPDPSTVELQAVEDRLPETALESELIDIWADLLPQAVGVETSFFMAGGHSLLAMQLLSVVKARYQVDVAIPDFLMQPTIEVLAQLIQTAQNQDNTSSFPEISEIDLGQPQPLSIPQQRIWLLEQLGAVEGAYHIAMAQRLTGDFEFERVKQCLDILLERHQVLRTTFSVDEAGQPIQIIHDHLPITIDRKAASELNSDLPTYLNQYAAQPFDLAQGPLVRLLWVQEAPGQQTLLTVVHHLIADAWSVGILIQELMLLYPAIANGQESPLPKLPITYAAFAQWQREYLQGEVLEAQRQYWQRQLECAPTLLDLPFDNPRSVQQSFSGAVKRVSVSSAISQAVQRFSQERGVSLYMTLLATYGLLLHRYSQQPEIMIGSPTANRTHPQTQGLMGLFLNTLVLRLNCGGVASFEELLTQTQQTTLEAFAHQDVPFEQLIEGQSDRQTQTSPWFQVMFILQNTHRNQLTLPNLEIESIPVDMGVAKFDITLSMEEHEDGLVGEWEYNCDLFNSETIERMAAQFEHLLSVVVAQPQALLQTLSLPQSEQSKLAAFSKSSAAIDTLLVPIQAEFEQHVIRQSQAIALEFESQSWTYQTLNEKANQIAHRLKSMGINVGDIVGVCLHRSPETIAALLGILKAGAAYLPVDPTYPSERIQLMLTDAKPKAMVTDSTLLDELKLSENSECLVISEVFETDTSTENLEVSISLEQSAYVIYTSGSTGRPKGTVLSHEGLANFTREAIARYGFCPEDRVLQFASISFDAAVEEIYGTLCSGGTLVLRTDEMIQSYDSFIQACDTQRISVLDLPTAFWHQLTQELTQKAIALPHSLRLVIIGGERVLPQRVALWQSLPSAAQVQLLNTYGPTEATVVATTYEIDHGTPLSEGLELPIGRPLGNVSVYVLDSCLNQVPLGVIGELYIGGRGLAIGYLHQPDLTAERFIESPFNSGERLYKTGDRVKFLPDGNLMYLGRNDDQIKVRGFRVELGEVENALQSHPQISQCAVIAHEDDQGVQRLIAYVVSDQETLHIPKLRNFLQGIMPHYMIPSLFIPLDSLPLTPAGKVNRRSLPDPSTVDLQVVEDRLPETALESELIDLWADLLPQAVGVETSFFMAGGHSLMAMQLLSVVKAEYQVDVAIPDFLMQPTIEVLAQLIQTAQTQDNNSSFSEISEIDLNQPQPLSIPQQRIWILEQLGTVEGAYHISMAQRLTGDFEFKRVAQCLDILVNRHEVLRTTFAVDESGQPIQIIHDHLPITIDRKAANDLDSDLPTYLNQYAAKPFDLAQGPLVRLLWVQEAPGQQTLLTVVHHLIADAWSVGILIQELMLLYPAIANGQESPLPKLPITYAAFAQWQREYLQGEVLESQRQYWQRQLEGAPTLLDLPFDNPRSVQQSFSGAVKRVSVSSAISQAVQRFSQERGVSLYMTLLATYGLLLHRYSQQPEIMIGSPTANRTHPQTQGLMGLFLNTLVLRLDCGGGVASFEELLTQTQKTALEAFAHQDVPFEQLIEGQSERQTQTSPWFQVMFILQNAHRNQLTLPNLEVEPIPVDMGVAKFDITLSMEEDEDGLVGEWEYNCDLFNSETIERMAAQFEHLLSVVVEQPQASLRSLSLPNSERSQLARFAQSTPAAESQLSPISVWFEQQVIDYAQNIALEFESQSWTYQTLNEKANQIAHSLVNRGISSGDIVGVCLHRSPETIAALLGILKAGAAYLPVDPTYPTERIQLMLTDAKPKAMVTDSSLLDELKLSENSECLVISEVFSSATSTENLEIAVSLDQPAYVIYTSGSTGRPKGTVLSHEGLANFTREAIARYNFCPEDRVLQFASISFDAAVEEIYGTLCSGGTLVLRTDEMIQSYDSFIQACDIQHISVLDLPTAFWHQLTQELTQQAIALPHSLRLVIIGGERVLPQRVALWQSLPSAARVQLLNTYGPTEATVVATTYEIDHGTPLTEGLELPIGRPLGNVSVYVLDSCLNQVPLGVMGELYIGGRGLAIGYLHQPDFTTERFIESPFDSGERLYKTGDRVKFLPDGNLMYLGRNDDQIKVRGFRVELGEVENALQSHPQISQCAVIAHEDDQGVQQLIAYVISDQETLHIPKLRNFLQGIMPHYMIPSLFIPLDSLPLTPAGKVNRRSLPDPSTVDLQVVEDRLPETALESELIDIWADLLPQRVGVETSFFMAGGHSLMAMQLLSVVKAQYQVDVAIPDFLMQPTIEVLAQLIQTAQTQDNNSSFSEISEIDLNQPQPLSIPQQRIWILEQLGTVEGAYHISMAQRLTGDFEFKRVAQCLDILVNRHEVLRTTFAVDESGQPIQIIHDHLPITIDRKAANDLDSDLPTYLNQYAAKPFDLAQGPLVRLLWVQEAPGQQTLLTVVHHLIADAWSVGILIQELMLLYPAIANGQESPLPKLPITYAAFSQWQREYLQGEVLESQRQYWQRQLEGAPTLLDLPFDNPRSVQQSFRGAVKRVSVSRSISQSVQRFSQERGVSLYMTLLATYGLLLHRYSQQPEIMIGSPIANRTHPQTQGIMGLFLNTLVLRLNCGGVTSFEELLTQTQKTALEAFAHQDVPFEQLIEGQSERQTQTSPWFQVMFILQNAHRNQLTLPNLEVEPIPVDMGVAKFDITLSMEEDEDGLVGEWEYNCDLFNSETIERMAAQFEHLLSVVVENPQALLQTLSLPQSEQSQLAAFAKSSDAIDTLLVPIQTAFEQQVTRQSQAIALEFESQSWTYQTLNEKANQIAHRLKSMGINVGDIVGVCLHRSPEVIAALLGILKAGATYLPVDPNYPSERIQLMLTDAKPKAMVTDSTLLDELKLSENSECLVISEVFEADTSTENLEIAISLDQPAYVIYTSGSTGRPKGTVLSHEGLANFTREAIARYGFCPEDRVLQFASISFDAAVEEIYGTLCSGGTLVLRTNEMIRSSEAFCQACESQRISVLDLPTAFWHQLTQDLSQQMAQLPSGLRLVIIGGERVLSQRVALWQSLPNTDSIQLLNTYGPTEATVVATTYEINAQTRLDEGVDIPIGRPLGNVSVHVLDAQHNPVPLGAIGELYLGGAGVAIGYLHQPELTAERFVEQADLGERLYKTGDRVKFLPDGNLVYLGRNDDQVKIRGFRVELGEIENLLQSHPQISDCAVIPQTDAQGIIQLIAYVVAGDSENASQGQGYRQFLQDQLPPYMIPALFMLIPELPITPTGKVDRRSLPTPQPQDWNTTTEYVAPTNPTEAAVSFIVAEVLDQERVGIHDDFFSLGGHSLSAMQVIARVQTLFSKEISLRSIFSAPTVAALAAEIDRVDSAQTSEKQHSENQIPQASDSQPIPLSSAQQRLWFLDQLEGQSATYNLPFALRVSGHLQLPAMEQCLQTILTRHEVLRTTFVSDDNSVSQVVHPNPPLPLTVENITDLNRPETDQTDTSQLEELIQKKMRAEAETPFDLGVAPLLRVTLLQISSTEHILLITMHHIIADGWSIGLFIQEVIGLYPKYCDGQTPILPSLPIQYGDYAAWQIQQQQTEAFQARRDQWVKQFENAPPVLDLPTDFSRPTVQSFQGGLVRHALPSDLTQRLKASAQEWKTTLFMPLLAAYVTLLYRYSGQSDLVIGTPVAGRPHPELEELIGFFINTLPLRFKGIESLSFRDLLDQVKQGVLEGFDYQDIPFSQLIERLPLSRDLSYLPLCQVMFVLQNAPATAFELPELSLEPLSTHGGVSRFDLTLSMTETDGQLVGEWEYNSDIFEVSTIERMAEQFEVLLQGIIAAPETSIERLPMLSENAQQQLLVEWNQTQQELPIECIHHWIEAQVEATPDAMALEFNGETLTYRAVNQRANQLAHYLISLDLQPDQLVGICLDRSLELWISVLAVWKAGGAYVPLDPAYPAERLNHIAQTAELDLVILQPELEQAFSHLETIHHPIALSTLTSTLMQQSIENPQVAVHPHHLAYVIFTSGSTGQPKGVMVEHRGLGNLAQAQIEAFQVTAHSRILQHASFSFDASVSEYLMALCTGACLCIEPSMRAQEQGLLSLLQNQKISHLTATPSLLQYLPSDQPIPVSHLIVAGEACSPDVMAQWSQGRHFYNAYGPTEASVCATLLQCDPILLAGNKPPIGSPIQNVQVYVLDDQQHLVPPGVVGELYIGGIGLARGYWNRPELTAERFIEHPFVPGERLYRTGDLVKWLANGQLDYIGRIDQQVKLRGFRIELAEIEAVLLQHPDVNQAAVKIHITDSGMETLVGYVVLSETSESISGTELRSFSQRQLPEYMVPVTILALDSFPLTPNGKIDLKNFPAPQNLNLETRNYVAPRNEIESRLVELWEEVTGISDIGIEDNFFSLGGHSLSAMQMLAQLRTLFGKEVSLRSLFEEPTIANLADLMQSNPVTYRPQDDIPTLDLTQPLPLSISQQRMWVLEQLGNLKGAYHIAIAQRLQGPLDYEVLNQCFQIMVERHAILRTTFSLDDEGQPVQIIHDKLDLTIERQMAEALLMEVQSYVNHYAKLPIDLVAGPPIRVLWIQEAEQQQTLVMVMHHIVADGWSLANLVEELTLLYSALSQGRDNPLPPLPIQYAEYAQWQRQALQGDLLGEHKAYWQDKLKGAPTQLELPTDAPRSAQQGFKGEVLEVQLSQDVSQGAYQLSKDCGVSLYMTLVATFALILHRYSQQPEVMIGSPIANRNHPQVEKLIGLFLNTLVLRVDCGSVDHFSALLAQAQDTILGAFEHQDVPFETLIDDLSQERQGNGSPWFQVMFILQNAPSMPLELTEIEAEYVPIDMGVAKFDITLSMTETEDGIIGQWEYNSDLFDANTIERMAAQFEHVLSVVVDNPHVSLQALALPQPEQAQLTTFAQSRPAIEAPLVTVQAAFEELVSRQSQAIALEFESESWTYQTLNEKANQIAHGLINLGINVGDIVGVCLHRSPETIAALLGILKAGAAYLPVDPTYPSERIQLMLTDAKPKAMVTDSTLLDELKLSENSECLVISEVFSSATSTENLEIAVSLDQPAYVIYTSGSTGRPKGTVLSHEGLANFTREAIARYGFCPEDRVLQFASISFDAAVEEIYGTLCSGGTLVLRTDEMIRSSETFCQACETQRISVLDLPTAFWHQLTQDLSQQMAQLPSGLRLVIIGGERVLPQRVALWQSLPNTDSIQLLNTYGPTEATVVATTYEINAQTSLDEGVDIPIGRPLGNVSVHVLDAQLNPVPLGAVGELYLGGPGVAIGYLHQPELTAERFIEQADLGERLYKTGDRVKFLPDGNLVYLGRNDDQVKIRGFRVELGEIENLLQSHPQISDCAVIAQNVAQEVIQLIAYVVSTQGNPEIQTEEYRQFLKDRLPSYMVPALFMTMSELPLTPAGKVDRRSLPTPQPQDWNTTTESNIAPRNHIEAELITIWEMLLKVSPIGIDDDFFALGGHSLMAMQLLAKVKKKYQIDIPLQPLFERPTIGQLADLVFVEQMLKLDPPLLNRLLTEVEQHTS